MTKTIRVSGAGHDRRVVLWEKDPAHPKGEIMIVNDGQTYAVGETTAIKRLLAEGRLVTEQTTPVGKQTPPTETRDAEPQDAEPQEWAGYDAMNVEDAVAFIRGLDEAERAVAIEYERGNKNRRGVLDAIEAA